jgi:hypothetical protein
MSRYFTTAFSSMTAMEPTDRLILSSSAFSLLTGADLKKKKKKKHKQQQKKEKKRTGDEQSTNDNSHRTI